MYFVNIHFVCLLAVMLTVICDLFAVACCGMFRLQACLRPACGCVSQSNCPLSLLARSCKHGAIGGIMTVYRNSDDIECFRSRILFKEDMQSLNVFKRHVEEFLRLKKGLKSSNQTVS